MLWGLFLFVRQAVRDAAGDQTWSVMMYGQWVGDTVKDLQTYASLKQTKACGKKAFGEKLEPKPQPNSLGRYLQSAMSFCTERSGSSTSCAF